MSGPTTTLLGRRFDTGQVVQVECAAGRVESIRPVQPADAPDHLPWIAPGLVDLQINGYGGIELTSETLTPEQVAAVFTSQDPFGVVRACPTITTHCEAVLQHAVRTIAQAAESSREVARRFAGIHLEGPFISPCDGPRGAHPKEHVRPPDPELFRRLQDAARGTIRLLTLAPETEGAVELIRAAVAMDVRVAIGHTAADSDAIARAVDAGATLSTHLGNGAHAMLPRHPNYLWDQLAEDRLLATLIADGVHLPPPVLQTMIRAKQPHRCLLVSDLAGTAGQPPGTYTTPLGRVEVLDDGRIVVAGQRQYLAGAGLPLDRGLSHVVERGLVPLPEAIAMGSTRPASVIGLPPHGLGWGHRADLFLFERTASGGLQVTATVLGGELVWTATSS